MPVKVHGGTFIFLSRGLGIQKLSSGSQRVDSKHKELHVLLRSQGYDVVRLGTASDAVQEEVVGEAAHKQPVQVLQTLILSGILTVQTSAGKAPGQGTREAPRQLVTMSYTLAARGDLLLDLLLTNSEKLLVSVVRGQRGLQQWQEDCIEGLEEGLDSG